MNKWIPVAAAALAATVATGALAQQRLPRECRAEIVRLCGTDRGKIRSCLQQKYTELSENCQTELRKRVAQRREAAAEESQSEAQEIAYGEAALQKLDFYAAPASDAPLVLFVHGGGWKRGDKRNATGAYKAGHFTGLGYHFASVNYRLVPDATVEQQAADVAASLAELMRRADALGIDRDRVVLMGHSAGAHLVALVGTDPRYLAGAGLSFADVAGIVPLDGAGYDVPAQMGENRRLLGDTYEQAFGTDLARQRALSPTSHGAAPNAPAFLILHVERADAKRQSEGLAAALREAGTAVEVRALAGRGLRGHMEINRELGNPDYPGTPIVDVWLKARFGG